MTKPGGTAFLARLLFALILGATFADPAHAQGETGYNVGDVIEFQYNDRTGTSNQNVWMKGKIATKCMGDTCGLLKWSDQTNSWMEGTIYTSLANIRRPGENQTARAPQAPAPARGAAPKKAGDKIDLLPGSPGIGGK